MVRYFHSTMESAAFASQRSRVRIPPGPLKAGPRANIVRAGPRFQWIMERGSRTARAGVAGKQVPAVRKSTRRQRIRLARKPTSRRRATCPVGSRAGRGRIPPGFQRGIRTHRAAARRFGAQPPQSGGSWRGDARAGVAGKQVPAVRKSTRRQRIRLARKPTSRRRATCPVGSRAGRGRVIFGAPIEKSLDIYGAYDVFANTLFKATPITDAIIHLIMLMYGKEASNRKQ